MKQLDFELVRTQALLPDTCVFVLPEIGITDRNSLFDSIRARLPLDPPLVGSRSWDALSDSLWGGLDAQSCHRIVIVWPNARLMANAAPDDFDMALNVLEDVSNLLADPGATNADPKELCILVG